MNPIFVGIYVLMFGFLVGEFVLVRDVRRFMSYVKVKYPREWRKMTDELPMHRIIIFYSIGTLTYFIFKSSEDFGDLSVTNMRRQIQRRVRLFLVFPISFVIYFVVIIWYVNHASNGGLQIRWFQ